MSSSQHTVKDDDHDIRLDRWFKRHYPGLPHGMLEKYLRKGLIRLEGKKASASARVQEGQVIDIRCPLEEVAKHKVPRVLRQVSPEDVTFIQNLVLYKDANIIVINKPPDLPVQGGSKISRSVDDLLPGLLFDAKERPKLAHRLDRDTSGVLVLARNAKIAAKLAKAFAGKTIEKTYWALVNGAPLQMHGVIDAPLLKAMYGEREQVGIDEEEGKYAKTEYRVRDALARRFAWMELRPLTGRMHQLRVHMASIGCPIVGDHKYGGSTSDGKALGVEDILHLHARRIVIPASVLGKQVDVSAPLPAHMKQSFLALGLDIPKK